MFGPFKLKSTIGRSHNVDLEDVLKTKQVLQSLGYYKSPKHGMNQYPDHEMFKGIERFQPDYGLRKDGVIRPDGPTADRLGEVIDKQKNTKEINDPADPDNSMPEIKPPNVDPNMPIIDKPFSPKPPKSDPYVDEHGNIILEGRNPNNGLWIRPPRRI